MGKNKHNVDEVVKSLLRKRGVLSIDTSLKVIEVHKDSTDLGNGSWGKIDFLTKYNGYRVLKSVG